MRGDVGGGKLGVVAVNFKRMRGQIYGIGYVRRDEDE